MKLFYYQIVFNEVLKKLLESKKVTQRSLAKNLNLAESTVSGYVSGTSEPDFDTLKKIANFFNVSVSIFFDEPNNLNIEMNRDDYNLIDYHQREIQRILAKYKHD